MFDPTAIQKFASRVSAAAKTKAPEVRIDINDAMEIAAALMMMLSERSSTPPPSIKPTDGGSFK